MKTPVRTVRIPDPSWSKLRDRAHSIGSDASAVIRDLVDQWLIDTDPDKD